MKLKILGKKFDKRELDDLLDWEKEQERLSELGIMMDNHEEKPITDGEEIEVPMAVRDELIMGYKYTGVDSNYVEIYFDGGALPFDMCICKLNDKLINELDDIINRNK